MKIGMDKMKISGAHSAGPGHEHSSKAPYGRNFGYYDEDIRRGWGFKGLVMTDWGGGSDAAAQMKAGNDLIMPGDADKIAAIAAAVKGLDTAVLDVNVEKILNQILKSPRYKGYAFSNTPDLKKHAEPAGKAAEDGMVLLKNEGSALPFRGDIKTIAAFGNTSYDAITGGTGSGDVNEAYSVSLEEGWKTQAILLTKN